jgi:hypothetical protein
MVDNIAKCIASQLNLDGDIFSVVYKRFANATKKETEIFTDKVITVDAQVDISMKEIHSKAHDVLFSDENINGNTLQTLLISRLKDEFKRKGLIGGETQDQLEDALSLILATHPKTVKDAKRKCYANFVQVKQAASIPDYIKAPEPLPPSSKNLYKIFPAGLTSDEKEFATILDNDTSGTILWWHRNPDRKPYSVMIVTPDIKHDFYPDFIVGIKGRDTENSILLIEVKGEIYRNDVKSIAKARAIHKIYKKVLMVEWQDRRKWMTIINDEKNEYNITDQQFRISLLETW